MNADLLEQLLKDTNFEEEKISKLVQGFKHGFGIGYQGSLQCRHTSENIPFTVGNTTEMWNKIMKEVNLGRSVGPFAEQEIPYEFYVQSPIRLVLKAGNKTRLIFHLSYDFTKNIT